MTVEGFKEFINKLNEIGIHTYQVKAQGGNRTLYNNDNPDMPNQDTTGKIAILGDDLISVEVTRNNILPERRFFVTRTSIESCDCVMAPDLTEENTKKLLQELGVYNDEWKAFFGKIPRKMDIMPGTAGITTMKDKDGNDTLPPHSVGMITYGKQ
jgi:hypothetical protein